jgi:uncharacterized membrane protein YbhN (UPF0104 family)
MPSRDGLPSRILDPSFVRWLALFVLAGAAIYLGGMIWSGWAQVAGAFVRLGPLPLLLAAAVASLAYLVRFCRWHLILRWMGSDVPVRANLGIYMSGLALTASPGKVGELMRTVLLSPFGVSPRRSLAAFLADRLSDVIGVCFLGAMAGWMNGESSPYLATVLALLLAGSFVFRGLIQHAGLWAHASEFLTRRGKRWGALAADAAFEWARVWSLPRVVLFSATASIAYGIQALVFAGLCRALGLDLPLLRAIEIFVSATLLGAASGLPGGLGAMEAALVVQLMSQGANSALAITAAIATRLVTLWWGVLLGLGSLLAVVARLEALAVPESRQAPRRDLNSE